MEDRVESRYALSAAQQQARQQSEQRAVQRALQQADRDRDAKRQEKERLRKEVEADRNAKARADAQRVQPAPVAQEPAASAAQSLPSLNTQGQAVAIQVRLTSGNVIKFSLAAEQPFGDLLAAVAAQEPLNPARWMIIQPFPRRTFEEADLAQPLCELGLGPRCSLAVHRLESPGAAIHPIAPAAAPNAPSAPSIADHPSPDAPQLGDAAQEQDSNPAQEAVLPGRDIAEPDEEDAPIDEPEEMDEEELEERADEDEEGDHLPRAPGLGQRPMQRRGPRGHQPFQGQGHLLGANARGADQAAEANLVPASLDRRLLIAERARQRATLQKQREAEFAEGPLRARKFTVPSLTKLCLDFIIPRLKPAHGSIQSLAGIDGGSAAKIIDALALRKQLTPKMMEMFLTCRLQHLSFFASVAATDEFCQALRLHSSLKSLRFVACDLLTKEAITAISHLKRLSLLDLQSCRLSDSIFPAVMRLEQLQHLVLDNLDISDAGLSRLLTRPVGLQLISLSLNGCSQVSDASLRHIGKLTGLQSLGLAESQIRDLSSLANLTNLRSLNICGTAVTDAELVRLAPLHQLQELKIKGVAVSATSFRALGPSLKRLTTILLPSNSSINDELLASLTGFPLTTLNLAACSRITDSGLAVLEALTPTLSELDLSNTKVSAAGLQHVCILGNLRHLNLTHTAVTDELATRLTGLSQLRALNLSRTAVSDAFLQAPSLADWRSLRALDVSHTSVTTDGVLSLHLPNLVRLNISGNRIDPLLCTQALPGVAIRAQLPAQEPARPLE
eukprot:m.708749 g.708749  ORF g.708749 m.708749 type:complete len:788 (-) comp58748_c0_seq4:73-2436(-)